MRLYRDLPPSPSPPLPPIHTTPAVHGTDSNIPPCLHLLRYELEFVIVFLSLLKGEDDDEQMNVDEDDHNHSQNNDQSKVFRSRHAMFSFAAVRTNSLLTHREGRQTPLLSFSLSSYMRKNNTIHSRSSLM